MMNNFEQAVQFLVDPRDGYDSEGGYVNDPKDPGGETNYGIAKRSHPTVDIKKLTLADAMAIYKREYWDFYRLYSLESPFCIVALDSYVQHSPTAVKRMLELSGTNWKLLIQSRIQYYLKLIKKNPDLGRFRKGWMNRMNDLSKYCTIIEETGKQ